jgi:hypothetical protein
MRFDEMVSLPVTVVLVVVLVVVLAAVIGRAGGGGGLEKLGRVVSSGPFPNFPDDASPSSCSSTLLK